jgi:hypothetical protein
LPILYIGTRLGTAIAMPKQNCTHKNTQAQIIKLK